MIVEVLEKFTKHKDLLQLVNQGSRDQAPVVRRVDIAPNIHRVNHYPADKNYQNQLSYPVDSDLPGG